MATFHPFMRTQSSGDHGKQEPWSFGKDALDIVRRFIKLRYRLLPYIYTAFYQYAKNGTPILRPLPFMDQEDHDTWYREDEFMLGENILVCPVFESGTSGRNVYLPNGFWYDYWSDEKLEGKKEHWIETPLETIPIYIRPGAVLPTYPTMNYVGEKPIDQLKLDIYYVDGQLRSGLYEDRGEGYGYTRGYFNEKVFHVKGNQNSLQIYQHVSGNFDPEYKSLEVRFHGLPFNPTKLAIDDKVVMEFNEKIPLPETMEIAKDFSELKIYSED
jgi:alpha-glucosidase